MTPDLDAIGVPDDESLCRLFGYQYSAGEPVASTRVVLRLVNPPQVSEDAVLESHDMVVESDEDGLWTIDLVRELTYLLTVWNSGIFNLSIVIPDEDVYNVADLL